MNTVAPIPVGMYFIRKLEVDVEQKEFSLAGLFRHRNFDDFPTKPIQFTAFAMLTGGRGGRFAAIGSLSASPGARL